MRSLVRYAGGYVHCPTVSNRLWVEWLRLP